MPQTDLQLEPPKQFDDDLMQMMVVNYRLVVKICDAFDWIFASSGGPSFRLHKLWNNLLGFDIVTFDEAVIKSNENESIAEAILRQYGIMGVNLIKLLISSEEDKQKYLDSVEGQLDFSVQWEMFKAGTLRFGQGEPYGIDAQIR